jgi:excisionase family DNA binding protein
MELLKIPDAAKMLAISKRAVYDLISAGKLTPYRPTAKKTVIRLLRSDVEAHIAASAAAKPGAGTKDRERRPGPIGLPTLARFGYYRPGTEPAKN